MKWQKNFFLLTIAFVFLSFTILFICVRPNSRNILGIQTPAPTIVPIVVTPYVTVQRSNLYLDGSPYAFVGVNAYHIAGLRGVTGGCGGYEADLDAFFAKLPAHSVVRTWAFQGGMATNIQTKIIDWSGLDRLVNSASKSGTRLILTLGDQSGTCDDGAWKDIAWYESGFKVPKSGLSYLDYVRQIVTRYKDSLAIIAWEPVNEPIAVDCTTGKGTECFAHQKCSNESRSTKALRTFFDTVGGEIKRIDRNHIVSSGTIGDGQCGTIFEDYAYVHQSPGIDLASYHDYGHDLDALPGDQWNGLQKRLDQMKQIGKPLFIGEAGIKATRGSTQCVSYEQRSQLMKAKMDAQFDAGIVGFLIWDYTGGTSKICNFDVVAGDPLLSLLATASASTTR